jgi:hypothetical protein
MKHFKKWLLSEKIERNAIRSIILDILDAGNLDDNEQEEVLASKISEQPLIQKKLLNFSILKPYTDQILNFIKTHQQSNLIELINFIQELK